MNITQIDGSIILPAAPKTTFHELQKEYDFMAAEIITRKLIETGLTRSVLHYDLVSESIRSITMVRAADENVITFYYKKAISDYEVRYLEEGTEKLLAELKVVEDKLVGETVTENAIEITNYDLVSEDPQDLTISRDADQNIIKFYYTRAKTSYTVNYLEEGMNKVLAKQKSVEEQHVGSSVSESAIDINGYDLVSSFPP